MNEKLDLACAHRLTQLIGKKIKSSNPVMTSAGHINKLLCDEGIGSRIKGYIKGPKKDVIVTGTLQCKNKNYSVCVNLTGDSEKTNTTKVCVILSNGESRILISKQDIL